MAVKHTGCTRAGSDRECYLELVRAFPLRPIRSDEELSQAIGMIDQLLMRGDLNSGEQDYLDILTDIVEKHETEEHPIPAVSDAEMLKHLIDARGATQSEVAGATKIAGSTISEVLAGKRRLSRGHISKLAKYFHVSPAVFNFG